MKTSTTTSFWSLLLATVTAVGFVHVAATSDDKERYDILDTIIRRGSHDSAGMTGSLHDQPYDDDSYDLDGCISILLYGQEDCSGPVKKLVHAPIKTEPNCRK